MDASAHPLDPGPSGRQARVPEGRGSSRARFLARRPRALLTVLLAVLALGTTGAGTGPRIAFHRPVYAAEATDSVYVETFDGTPHAFVGRGGTEQLELRDDPDGSGGRVLAVSGRSETWHGPSVDVTSHLREGRHYGVSVWVKGDTSYPVRYQLTLQRGSGEAASYHPLDARSFSLDEGWVRLSGDFPVGTPKEAPLALYVEASDPTAAFAIDDLTVKEQGDLEMKHDDRLTPLREIYDDAFLIGNAVAEHELHGDHQALLSHHFNLVTAGNGMKPEALYDANRNFDFAEADKLVNRALELGFKVHGHVLVWHQQSPDWLHSHDDGTLRSREDAIEQMTTHIRTVVRHFGDRVISWDVVNEALDGAFSDPRDWTRWLRDSPWRRAIGDDYLYLAFVTARETLDELGLDDITLIYNDYNDDQQSKAETMYWMIHDLNARYREETGSDRPLVLGVGMQGHYHIHTRPEHVRQSIERFLDLGIDIAVTELDITTMTRNQPVPSELERQAVLYAELFKIYREYRDHISRVTFWGLEDGGSWRGDRYPTLFDASLAPKTAYEAVADPETFLATHEAEAEAAKRTAEAPYGMPDLTKFDDPLWEEASPLDVSQYQTAWQGASATARVLWDREGLYVRMDVRDPVVDVSSELPHEQDSVEVFVRENLSETPSYTPGDGQYRVNAKGALTVQPDTLGEGVRRETRATDTGYQVALFIPWQTLTPEGGETVGFDLQVNDAERGQRVAVAAWNDLSGQGYQDPTVFGQLTLQGEAPDTSPTESSEELPASEPTETVRTQETVGTEPEVTDESDTPEPSAGETSRPDASTPRPPSASEATDGRRRALGGLVAGLALVAAPILLHRMRRRKH